MTSASKSKPVTSAEATAVKQFRLTDEERERLVVRTRG
jgi:hypothetical protein